MQENPEVTIIGVTSPDEGDEQQLNRFISHMKVQVPHVLKNSREIWDQYEVHSQPTMVFVNSDGTFEQRLGRHDPPELLQLATEHLAS